MAPEAFRREFSKKNFFSKKNQKLYCSAVGVKRKKLFLETQKLYRSAYDLRAGNFMEKPEAVWQCRWFVIKCLGKPEAV